MGYTGENAMVTQRISWMNMTMLVCAAIFIPTTQGCADESTVNMERLQDWTVRLSVCAGESVASAWQVGFATDVSYGGTAYNAAVQAVMNCVVVASDCDGVLKCLSYDLDQECYTSSFTDQCHGGDTVRSCTSFENGYGWVYEVSCSEGLEAAAENDMCMVNDWGQPGCYAGTCSQSYATCEGNVVKTCDGDLLRRQGCEALGQICIEDSDGARCRNEDAEACEESHCDGHSLVICDWDWDDEVGFVSQRFNCASLGSVYTCAQSAYGSPYCRADAPIQCEDSESLCMSGQASLCVGGIWQKFSCAGFMSSRCDASDGSIRCVNDDWAHNIDALDGQITHSDGDSIGTSPSTGDSGGFNSSGEYCVAACDEYQNAVNACGQAIAGDGWTDIDQSCSSIEAACDYYDYGAYYECLTENYVPDDCAADDSTWGDISGCTLE
jgi:hypothetical protein